MSEPELPPSAEPNSGRTERLISFWSVRVPAVLERWTPDTADAFADGAWLAGLAPPLAAYAPIAGAALGFLAPFLWPGMQTVYSESLVFIAIVVVGAILSGPVGVMLLLGYVFGDLLSGARQASIGGIGGQLISYLLLAIPAVKIPTLVRRFVETDRLPENPLLRGALVAVLYGFTCGTLTFLWCQAMIVLIRPVFTWRGRSPDVSAIAPLQTNWEWIVALAVAVAVTRFTLEKRIAMQLPSRPNLDARPDRQRSRPSIIRAAFWAVGITLILAGTYESWTDVIAVAALAGLLGILRARPRILDKWSLMINDLPLLMRLAFASILGFFCSLVLLQGFWDTGSFRPLTLGALVTMCLFVLLFPPQAETSSEEIP